ncbi:hypothetical protein BU24DRAFT_428167 [Aaosphaeria arxii CBS 175.79]|uniref:Ecp2 effector protein domain-containing protein n=1 Tax=Aaosphaeria arxii CBS 175.79 TaxID=1450172 RepID=A0A6A5XBG4_9PLEO|nr:uncharacterized protein BU24DRAFT_428167 [Aaosphaeria arxii CBS 175.79]KAF2010137.1 hypothetical protein BU24DRAFT_428167 [Aaosphaeria arxii CBS 175.79]
MYTNILATLLAVAPFVAASPVSPEPHGAPVGIRECSGSSLTSDDFNAFADVILTKESFTAQPSMTRYQFQEQVNGKCVQVQIYNQNCNNAYEVDGDSLANTIRSITEQCSETAGQTAGWGYYRNVNTADTYKNQLWVLTSECNTRIIRSACAP